MEQVKFKTRILESIYFSLFGFFLGVSFSMLAFKVYDKSFVAFLLILFLAFLIFIFMIVLAFLFYQYCEFVDGVFIIKCPLYVIKKVKISEIVKYDRLSIYEKATRTSIIYPVIRIYLTKPNSKTKYKYLCERKSTYFHIYDIKDNYDKFIKIINSEI